jgi:hypothetical protein
MKRRFVARLGALAVLAAAAAPAGQALADDITIDPTTFVSTRTRADVRQEVAKSSLTEWERQYGGPHAVSSYTRAQARDAYVADRREVWALGGEDSGSAYPNWKAPTPSTRAMGGPAR